MIPMGFKDDHFEQFRVMACVTRDDELCRVRNMHIAKGYIIQSSISGDGTSLDDWCRRHVSQWQQYQAGQLEAATRNLERRDACVNFLLRHAAIDVGDVTRDMMNHLAITFTDGPVQYVAILVEQSTYGRRMRLLFPNNHAILPDDPYYEALRDRKARDEAAELARELHRLGVGMRRSTSDYWAISLKALLLNALSAKPTNPLLRDVTIGQRYEPDYDITWRPRRNILFAVNQAPPARPPTLKPHKARRSKLPPSSHNSRRVHQQHYQNPATNRGSTGRRNQQKR